MRYTLLLNSLSEFISDEKGILSVYYEIVNMSYLNKLTPNYNAE